GKGKVAHFFTIKENAKYCVRVGGPNSGHTVYRDGNPLIFRILPTGVIEKNTVAILPAGSYIDLSILKHEISISGINRDRLLIDENAVVISEQMKRAEIDSCLRELIGSTESGTGNAVVQRILRNDIGILAKNCLDLKSYICDTKRVMREACNNNEKIIIEGTQGFGLSLLHAKDFPYVTSRDTSAAAFLAETGLSPFDVKNIVMVIRAFPIRVSGKSGHLPNEIDWNIIREEAGYDYDMTEYTSCTKRVRRVARFDSEIVKSSIISNNPNIIVLNHLDYVKESIRNTFISQLENQISQKINFVGIDPISLKNKEEFL
ncbi:MAG: hypothetical protein HFK08_05925, partial [Clostridia bacterium]|nr:hypothetical protein [Clostridia bacterium]